MSIDTRANYYQQSSTRYNQAVDNLTAMKDRYINSMRMVNDLPYKSNSSYEKYIKAQEEKHKKILEIYEEYVRIEQAKLLLARKDYDQAVREYNDTLLETKKTTARKNKAEKLEREREELQRKINATQSQLSAAYEDEARAKTEQDKKLAQERIKTYEAERDAQEKRRKTLDEEDRQLAREKRQFEKDLAHKELSLNQRLQQGLSELDAYNKANKLNKKLYEEGLLTEKEYREAVSENYSTLSPTGKSLANSALSEYLPKFFTILSKISGVVSKVSDKLDQAVDNAMTSYSQNIGRVNARLYGDPEYYEKGFGGIINELRDSLRSSPFISASKVMDNIVELTQRGVDYNIEQRALLQSLKDELVPTFDAFNDNLERMIRLQQADTTMSQMGVEARLQQFLTSIFKDSSYLNGMYDEVYSALQDTMAIQLNNGLSTELGFTVQKWLGSLYSLGLSSSAVSGIARAINLLGTGDINQLGDSNAQTLLALASGRAGLSYASLLTNGLTNTDTNDLLKAMVEYLSDIATNTQGNNVVRSQWGDILDFEMADWKAISNVTMQDINSIYSTTLTASQANEEFNKVLNQLDSRITIATKVDNALNNTLWNIGMGVVTDEGGTGIGNKYTTWKINQAIEGFVTSIAGEGGIVGTITSLVGAAARAKLIWDDLVNLPLDLAEAITNPSAGIFNLLGGYNFNLTRGDYTESSDTSTGSGVSNSSVGKSTGRLSSRRTKGSEGLDVFAGFNNESEPVTRTTHIDAQGVERLSGGSGGLTFGDVGEQVSSTGQERVQFNLAEQASAVSATAENIGNQENIAVRDINELYAELFERQTKPIRVAIASLETQAQLDYHIANLDDIRNKLHGTISVSADGDTWDSISSMRNGWS